MVLVTLQAFDRASKISAMTFADASWSRRSFQDLCLMSTFQENRSERLGASNSEPCHGRRDPNAALGGLARHEPRPALELPGAVFLDAGRAAARHPRRGAPGD